MADVLTTNLAMNKQEVGQHNNTWGTNLNTNLDYTDAKFGDRTTISSTGGTYTLSAAEQRVNVVKLTGNLASAFTLAFNATGGTWIIDNQMVQGAYAVTVKVTGQTGFTLTALGKSIVYYNGTDAVAAAVPSTALDATLTALAALDSTAGLVYETAADTFTKFPLVGVVSAYAGSSAPSGWLLCYGQNVSRTTYAALFTAISTTFGVGDGATTFGLPDLRGRAVFGKDNMGGVAASRLTGTPTGGITGSGLGNTGGEQGHTLTTAELPAHSLDMGRRSDLTAGGAQKAVNGGVGDTVTTSSIGSDSAHNNVPPGIVLNYIIFAAA